MSRARSFSKLINKDNYATYSGSDSVTDISAVSLPQGTLGFRNKIINGDMRISQRNSSNQVTPPTNGDTTQTNNYPVDRWFIQNSSGSATIFGQQVTDVPNGNFQHSVKISTTTAINTTQAQQLNFQQRIEGYNVADFGFGSTSAKSMTFSFYVKSNVLGNYGFIIHNGNVCFVSKYEITTEDVWKKVTINLTPQTSYALSNSTNGTGLYINFDLGCGSDFESNNEGWQTGDFKRPINCIKWANNTNATLYITGVQLEEGTVPTPFEHRPYGTELALCQRYAHFIRPAAQYAAIGVGRAWSATQGNAHVYLPVSMRGAIAIEYSNLSHFDLPPAGEGVNSLHNDGSTEQTVKVGWTRNSNISSGTYYQLEFEDSNWQNAYLGFTSEL